MSNKVFLLLPLTDTIGTPEEVCLKVISKWPEQLVGELCFRISEFEKLNDHELYDKLFDQRKYNNIRNIVKAREKGLRPRPSFVTRLDKAFANFVDFHNNRDLDSKTPITIEHVTLVDTVINAYINFPNKALLTLVDADALRIPLNKVSIIDGNGNDVHETLSILALDPKKLYLWFIEHREPNRDYDPNYKKHGMSEKWSKKGVKISKMSYKPTDAKILLRKAVGAKDDKKNLFFYDKNKGKMLVFWNEGLPQPTYHGYEVEYDNLIIQKIYAKGSTELKKKIETVADF